MASQVRRQRFLSLTNLTMGGNPNLPPPRQFDTEPEPNTLIFEDQSLGLRFKLPKKILRASNFLGPAEFSTPFSMLHLAKNRCVCGK